MQLTRHNRTMPRQNLLALLRKHRPSDAGEAEMLARTLGFVEGENRSLDATLQTGHVTASAWVLGRDCSLPAVLLTHHRKLGRWFQLGGHLEAGETVLAGALREAREESGLTGVRPLSEDVFDVDVHPIPERSSAPAHDHYDIRFLLDGPMEEPLVASSESRALEWVRLDEAHRYNSSESILRMVRKTLYGKTSG